MSSLLKFSLALLPLLHSLVVANADDAIDPVTFANPPSEYRPIDCWWWDGAEIEEEKLRHQIEDMDSKGIGGTWLYPRFGAKQSMSGDPGFWTDGWWDRVRFTLKEQQRLGMTQWANDWLGRLDKAYFQNQIRAERESHPDLWGRRLIVHKKPTSAGPTIVEIPQGETILTAAAYRLVNKDDQAVDGDTRIDLMEFLQQHQIRWTPPPGDWLIVVLCHGRHDLNYLSPIVARRWIEIYFERYAEELGPALGKTLTAYGPDERSVLDGNILFSDELIERFRNTKGYDPIGELAALFIDIGSRTDKVRCDYYDVMITLIDENFYRPIEEWLHDHGMKQVTIATWGREDMLGQTRNYGDFFRFMSHFDIPGNEDSQESGTGAFIDSKLSSSIAHLNRRPRVAVCAYWGTGWGFTQEENIARTNINFALGTTLYNTHGVLYALMGGRNEFVPPEVHFYQPYWKTWKSFTDRVARTCYALSQGSHQADVGILYPLSTLHAHWHSGSEFGPAAQRAEETCFGLAKGIYQCGIDFDFLDEASVAAATASRGRLHVAAMEFPVLLLPTLSTIRLDALKAAAKHVENGGVLIAFGSLPTASAERGRHDPDIARTLSDLFGGNIPSEEAVVKSTHASGGKAILMRGSIDAVGPLIRDEITPDVMADVPDIVHTHQRIGASDLYFLVNKHPQSREVNVSVAATGTPEVWDASTGAVRPHYRFERGPTWTKLRLTLGPHEGILVRVDPEKSAPAITNDNLTGIDALSREETGYSAVGFVQHNQDVRVVLNANGVTFAGSTPGKSCPDPIPLTGNWECEFRPTLDNRWGDFQYPPSDQLLGPQIPRMEYRSEPRGEKPALETRAPNDEDWQEVEATFGPYWQELSIDEQADNLELRRQMVTGGTDTRVAVRIDDKPYHWKPYVYSWKYGTRNVDIHQRGMDGLGPVSPDFLVFDAADQCTIRYLQTRIYCAEACSKFLHFGSPKDRLERQAWLNGKEVAKVDESHEQAIAVADLKAGWNSVVLRICQRPGQRFAMFAVFLDAKTIPNPPRYLPISQWYAHSHEWTYDCLPDEPSCYGWYRFQIPPGARSLKLNLVSESVEAWIEGKPARVQGDWLSLPNRANGSQIVMLRVKHRRGYYAGAAFKGPIEVEFGVGKIPSGDWSEHGLQYYSGGLVYRKICRLTEEQIHHKVFLDLGDVRTSAQVTVNGIPCGVGLSRPYRFDISAACRTGGNVIEVEVLNTLANFMSNSPTRYVYKGQTVSGLLGPAKIDFARKVSVLCHKAQTPR